MGVCCIVFDIDGMLFEFFMSFVNIEKNKILRINVFNISCFLNIGNIEKCPFIYWLNGRWFLQIVDIGNFNMKLNGRWFPQILDHVDRDNGNLYIYVAGTEGESDGNLHGETQEFKCNIFLYYFLIAVNCTGTSKQSKLTIAHGHHNYILRARPCLQYLIY